MPLSQVREESRPAMGCQQCLPLSIFQVKGKHCRKPHCRNGVVYELKQTLNVVVGGRGKTDSSRQDKKPALM